MSLSQGESVPREKTSLLDKSDLLQMCKETNERESPGWEISEDEQTLGRKRNLGIWDLGLGLEI